MGVKMADEDIHWMVRVRTTEEVKNRTEQLALTERRSLATLVGAILRDATAEVTLRSTA